MPKSPPSSTQDPPSAKRPGAPKAKGAVRAKSGCYTCRIRRKKCDEQPNGEGHCATCVRLHLECLGFGAKRPDWLRENRNVLQLRDKIKNFLASQGMIKGHSGSGTRSSDQPPILRLTITEAETPPYHSGSSSSPPSRSQTLSDEYGGRSRHPTSHTRGSGWNAIDQTYHTNGHYATNSEYHRSTSPPQSLENYPHQLSSSPHSLVQPYQRTIRYKPYPTYNQRQLIHQGANWTPAKSSTFGNSYNLGDSDFITLMDTGTFNLPSHYDPQVFPTDPLSYAFTQSLNAGNTTLAYTNCDLQEVGRLRRLYVTEVVTIQYTLGTSFSRELITSIINNESSCEQQAATLLSRVHYLRFVRPPSDLVLTSPDVSTQLHEIEQSLASRGVNLTSEDAMAALHLVSAVLFDGGHGQWSRYLNTAAVYVRNQMFGLYTNNNGLDELRKLKDKDAFIVKTAIWFDVLASVTTGEPPLLLDIVRKLFKPGMSGLHECGSETPTTYQFPTNFAMPEKEKTSMMSPMGCENKIVWALAEISALAKWKKDQKRDGKLSIKDLVLRAQEIEKELDTRINVPIRILADFEDHIAYSRYLTAHIFRATAALYLHAVLSDGYPHVTQIKMAVEEVMRWIRRIPKKPSDETGEKIHKVVIRSTMCAFYLTGALTDEPRHRKLLKEFLLSESGRVIGNVQITEQLLADIWRERDTHPERKTEVMWREKLFNDEDPILLV